MASTGTITGRNGEFVFDGNRVSRVTNWAINPTLATSTEWGDSDTAGYTARAAGRRDATFTAEGKFETTNPVWDMFKPGDVAVAVLWLDTTRYYHFPCALCLDFNLTVDIDTEEVVGWTSNWGADGIYYAPGQSGADSFVYPD